MRRSSIVAACAISLAGCTVDVVLARDGLDAGPAMDATDVTVPQDIAAEIQAPDSAVDVTSDAGAPDAGDGAVQQWTRVFAPTGYDLRGIWGSSSRDVWIVGDRGTLLHWTGTTWSPAMGPSNAVSYRDVWGSAADDVWAVGVESPGLLAIAHYDGRAWSRVAISPTRYAPRAVFGTSRRDAWIVGGPFEFASDSVLRWDGSRWNTVRTGGRPTRYLDVGGAAPDDLWIVSLDDTLVRWNGAFVTDAATLPVAVVSFELGLWASGVGNFWVTGDAGVLHHYVSGTWTSVDTGTTHLLRNVWGFDANTIWAVGNRGTIARFDGATWSAIEEITPRTLLSVWAASPADAWAIGEGGTILHSVR